MKLSLHELSHLLKLPFPSPPDGAAGPRLEAEGEDSCKLGQNSLGE
jgi:hypothetical protein